MWLLEKFKLHMVSHLWLTLWLCWAALFQTKQISHRDVKWLSQDSSASISRPQVWFYITEFTAISLNIQPLAKDFFFFFWLWNWVPDGVWVPENWGFFEKYCQHLLCDWLCFFSFFFPLVFFLLLLHCLGDCAAVIHFLRRLQKLVLYLKQLLLLTG